MINLKRKDMPKKYLLFIDMLSLIMSYFLSAWILYGSVTNQWFNYNYRIALSIVIFIYISVFYLYDTYTGLFKRGFIDEMVTVVKINLILAVSLTVVMFVFKEGTTYSRIFFFLFFLLNILTTYILRQYFKVFLLAVYKKSEANYKIMIITTSDQVHKVLNRFKKENEWEYQISYLTILDKDMIGHKYDGIEVKADRNNIFEVAKLEIIDGVFIHIPNHYQNDFDLDNCILRFQNMGVTVDVSINSFGLSIREKVVRQMSGYNVITYSSRVFNESQMLLKRVLDILGGLTGCIITLILIVFIAPAIKIESKGPIFFSQIRIGKNGRRFRIYKFRSMYIDAEERLNELIKENEMDGLMFKMKNDPRITKVGRFIRKTSIDEFPQFFNVLKGDMSLVGTRPPMEKEFLQYESRHKRRLVLKSGITGLWQVSGRSEINNFEDVVKLDLEYIDNWSLLMDIKILFRTISVVFFQKGSR